MVHEIGRVNNEADANLFIDYAIEAMAIGHKSAIIDANTGIGEESDVWIITFDGPKPLGDLLCIAFDAFRAAAELYIGKAPEAVSIAGMAWTTKVTEIKIDGDVSSDTFSDASGYEAALRDFEDSKERTDVQTLILKATDRNGNVLQTLRWDRPAAG